MEALSTAPPVPTITVQHDLHDLLLRAAVRGGKSVDDLAGEMLVRTLHNTPPRAAFLNGPTFREILAPLRKDFEATGMSDDELADFIAEAIAAHRREQALTDSD